MDWGICLKRVEKESFAKSFLLFFLSMGVMVAALFYMDFARSVLALEKTIHARMEICSYDLNCDEFAFDFVPLNAERLNKLVKSNDGALYSDFSVPGSNDYAMRIKLPKEAYEKRLTRLQKESLGRFASALFAVILLSLLFAWYSLRPLRNALRMTEEFVRDILHDFNTPLSTIRLNVAMLKRRWQDSTEIGRIEKGVQTILDLQQNLRDYLEQVSSNAKRLDLSKFVASRVEMVRGNSPGIRFDLQVDAATVVVDPKLFARILDNILSNAAKYNSDKGVVSVRYESDGKKLVVEDSGWGIQRPEKVFERYYKERETGHGIGMHIVKKLCDSIDVDIEVESEPEKGTRITLDLRPILSETTAR